MNLSIVKFNIFITPANFTFLLTLIESVAILDMDILDLATCFSLPKVAKGSRVSTARDNYWFMPLDSGTSLGSRLDDP